MSRLPAIPKLTTLDRTLQRVVEPIKHILEARLMPDAKHNRCPTIQEMLDAGVITKDQAEKL